MAVQKVNGQQLATEVNQETRQILSHYQYTPEIVDILIGDNQESHTYVNLKEAAAHKVGIRFHKKVYPQSFSPKMILEYIREQNANNKIHGILIQLPVPQPLDQTTLLKAIHPYKDIDALHPKNMGLLVHGNPTFLSPIILSTLKILKSTNRFPTKTIEYLGIELEVPDLTKETIAIVGNGLLVGKPLLAYLAHEQVTTILITPETQNPEDLLKKASIIITGTNSNNVLNPLHVNNDTIVIDVGMDVDFSRFEGKKITASMNPGGIGPITVAYLLYNAALSATTLHKHTT